MYILVFKFCLLFLTPKYPKTSKSSLISALALYETNFFRLPPDGLYISFRSQKYRNLLDKKIEAAVNQRLQELNIPSRLEWEDINKEKVEVELQAKQLEHQIKTNTLELANPAVEQEPESIVEEANEPEIPYHYTEEWFIDEYGIKLDFPEDIIDKNLQKQYMRRRMEHIAEIKQEFEDLVKSLGIKLVAS